MAHKACLPAPVIRRDLLQLQHLMIDRGFKLVPENVHTHLTSVRGYNVTTAEFKDDAQRIIYVRIYSMEGARAEITANLHHDKVAKQLTATSVESLLGLVDGIFKDEARRAK